MITKILVQLELPQRLQTPNIGSVLHGVLMELLPEERVQQLHTISSYSPLKQRLLFKEKKVFWEIVSLAPTLGLELKVIFEQLSNIYLKRHQVSVEIISVQVETVSVENLMNEYLQGKAFSRSVKVSILTPMSFKSAGQYDIFPDIKKIFRSIMRNFDAFSQDYQMYDGETLEYLVQQVRIGHYQLRSTSFQLENTSIPAFSGYIVLKIKGAPQWIRLVNFLLVYGSFSGVGIKTSLGMGKIEVNL